MVLGSTKTLRGAVGCDMPWSSFAVPYFTHPSKYLKTLPLNYTVSFISAFSRLNHIVHDLLLFYSPNPQAYDKLS